MNICVPEPMRTTKQYLQRGWTLTGRACIVLSVVVLQACATAELRSVPDVQSFGKSAAGLLQTVSSKDSKLKVMTFNMAHGRGDSFHQLLQSTDTTLDNLDAISVMLNREQPDVIALQEADGPSFWSGNFNHLVLCLVETPGRG